MTASFPLRALTLALDPATLAELGITGPSGLLGAGSPDGPLSWLRRGEGLLGFGEITSFTGSGPSRFADAEQWWKTLLATAAVDDSVRMPGTGAMAFGSFAFSKTSATGSVLIVPALVAGFSGGTAWLTQLTVDGTVPTAASALALLRDIAASHAVPFSLSTTPDAPS